MNLLIKLQDFLLKSLRKLPQYLDDEKEREIHARIVLNKIELSEKLGI